MTIRYNDDVFTVMTKNAVSTHQNQINSIDSHIYFTAQHETKEKIALL